MGRREVGTGHKQGITSGSFQGGWCLSAEWPGRNPMERLRNVLPLQEEAGSRAQSGDLVSKLGQFQGTFQGLTERMLSLFLSLLGAVQGSLFPAGWAQQPPGLWGTQLQEHPCP